MQQPTAGLAMLGAVLLGAACSGPGIDAPRDVPAGHGRMLAELVRYAVAAKEDNPYVGEARSRDLREQLAAVPKGQRDLRVFLFNRLLGGHELALGNADAAIEHYGRAYRLLDEWGDEIPLDEQLKTIFEFAVAHIRLGETQNCVRRHTAESCILPIRGGGRHVQRDASQQALVYLGEVLERAPRGSYYWIKAAWLANVAHMTLGEWPDGVPEAWRIDPAAFASPEDVPRFTDIAPSLGLATFDLAGGAVADDFDGDGRLEIVVTTSDPSGNMRYFHNDGDGTFRDRTEAAGLSGITGGLNLVHADYDGDGDLDLYVLRGAWWRENGRHLNSLLQNDGKGRFVDVTFDAGLGESAWPTQTAAFADYDNDGDLDLYVGNEYDFRPAGDDRPASGVAASCELWRNDGDGTFTNVAAAAGVANDRYAKAVVWGDFDNDRDPDLYVSNIGDANRLYRNEGDGTFTDVAPELGLTGPVSSFPAWFWDYDNDGWLDLFVSAYGGPRLPPDVAFTAASYMGLPHRGELPSLYHNDGDGTFTDLGRGSGFDRVTLPMGSNFGDLDNDGWLDCYLGTGYPYYEGLVPNVMYRNRAVAGVPGGRAFADVSTAGGFGHLQKGHGVVFADLDHDGDQDVFEQMGGFYPGDAFGNVLFENPGFGHRFVKLALVGRGSNRFGVGVRLRLDVSGPGGTRSIHRRVGTGATFGGNPLRQEIGLGDATRIDRLELYWPTTDTRQAFEDVPLDQVVRIVEGVAELEVLEHEVAPFRP